MHSCQIIAKGKVREPSFYEPTFKNGCLSLMIDSKSTNTFIQCKLSLTFINNP